MEGKLTIFVVCATVLQNSLAIMLATASGNQAGAMLDSSILKAYCAVAYFQAEKTVQRFSTIESQVFSAKTCLTDEYAAEENLYTTKTCRNEILVPLMATTDAVFAVILVVDSEASSSVTAARAITNRFLTNLVVDICSALELGMGKNSSGALAEIKAIADKQASEAVIFNTAVFGAILNGRNDHPKIESAIKSAQGKATSQIVRAVYAVFTGIQTLISVGTQANCEVVSAAIKIFGNQILSGITGDLKIKFDLLQDIFTASSIFDFGIVAISPAIGSALESVYENAGSGDPNTNVCVSLQDSEQNLPINVTQILSALKAIQIIFTTIMNHMVDDLSRHKNVTRDDACEVETAIEKTYTAFEATLNSTFDSVLLVNPKTSSVVRKSRSKAQSSLRILVDNIYAALELNHGHVSAETAAKIEFHRNATTCEASALIKAIYVAIRDDRRYSAEIETAIECARDKSIAEVVKVCDNVFIGINILISRKSPGTKPGNEDHLSLIKDAQKAASIAMIAEIQSHNDLFQAIVLADAQEKTKNSANSCIAATT